MDNEDKEAAAPLLSDSIRIRAEPLCLSYRLMVTMLCTMAMLICFAEQSGMGSAMVCMVLDTAAGHVNSTNNTNNTRDPPTADRSLDPYKFPWSKEEQGWVHSSLFVGYYIAQLPSGLLATRFGGKKLTVLGLLVSSVAQLVTPVAASGGLVWLCATRAVAGLSSGFIYAPVFAVLANWVPRAESSVLIGLAGTGMELGAVLCFGLSSFVCESTAIGGWPTTFYSVGVLGILTAVAFSIFVSDEPSQNVFVRQAERLYIQSAVYKSGDGGHTDNNDNTSQVRRIPMLTILTSPPVLAIVAAQIGTDWLYYLTITVLPDFMHETMLFPPSTVNLLTGLPFLSIIPAIYAAGTLADFLRRRRIMSTTAVRKVADFVSKIIPGLLLIAMGYLRPGQEALFIVLYLLSCIFLAASYVAWVTNPLDLAPAYAGLIASVCEIGAMWLAIVVPIIVEQITVDKSREQWLLVLYITGGLQLGTFLIYLAFGSSKLQSWARPEGRRKVSVGHPQVGNGAHSGEVAPTEAKVEVRASPWRPRSPSYMSDSEVGLLLYRPLTLGQPRPKSTPCGAVKRGSESGLDDSSDDDRTSAYGSLEVTI